MIYSGIATYAAMTITQEGGNAWQVPENGRFLIKIVAGWHLPWKIKQDYLAKFACMYDHKLDYLPHYTYTDYAGWEGDWELIYGVPYAMSPSPGMAHQRAGSNLHFHFRQALQQCSGCELFYELDWKIDETTVVRPDLMIACKPFAEGVYLSKTPVLIIEIFSPSSANRDRTLKYDLYEQAGVRYYLIVYPEKRNVDAFELIDGAYQPLQIKDDFAFHAGECSLKVNLGNIWETEKG